MPEQAKPSTMPPPVGRRGRKSRAPLLGATALTVGFYISAGLGYDPTHPVSSFLWAASFGLPGLAVVFAASFGGLVLLSRLLRRFVHRDRWLRGLLAACVLASVGLVVSSWRAAQPINLFRSEVLSPAPASLTDLRVAKHTSYSDGSAWLFAFRVSPEDFDALRNHLQLERIPVDLEQRRKDIAELLDGTESAEQVRRVTDSVFREDRMLRTTELYVRPAEPEFYAAGRITVVTDPSRSIVYLYVDRWSPR